MKGEARRRQCFGVQSDSVRSWWSGIWFSRLERLDWVALANLHVVMDTGNPTSLLSSNNRLGTPGNQSTGYDI